MLSDPDSIDTAAQVGDQVYGYLDFHRNNFSDALIQFPNGFTGSIGIDQSATPVLVDTSSMLRRLVG